MLRNSLKACLHSHGTTCRSKACILVWRSVTLAELEELGPHPVLAVDAAKATGVCYRLCRKWPTGNLLLERERWIRRHHACQLCWHIIGRSCHKYHFCCDKDAFVVTRCVLLRQNFRCDFCSDKLIFVATNTFVLRKHLFLCVTKVCLSWQTRVCCDKSFVATKIFCHNIILLQQAYFCCNKRCVLLWQKRYLAGLLPQPSRLMGSGSELELKNFSGPTKTIPVLTFATAIDFQASLVGIMLSHNELCTARSILSCCLWPCYVTILWGGYSPFNSELLSVAMLCYHTVRWVQPINAKLLSVAMLCYHTVRWVQPINAELLSVAMLCYHTVRWVQPIQFWAVVCGHAMGRPLQEKTLWAYSQLGLEVKMVLLRHHDSQTIIIKRWQRNRWHCYQRKKEKEEKEKKRKKLLGDQAKK